MNNSNSFSLYVNIPFCKSKCNYCDYFTVRNYNDYSKNYIDALMSEIILYKYYRLKTVYIGGGTPSILNYQLFEKLITCIKKNFILEQNTEFTIELNPDDVNIELIKTYKKFGINRISLGIQSFNDKILNYLGRRYNSNISQNSLKLIADNFENFSCDILFAIPKVQNVPILKNDLNKLLLFKVPHISIYNLVIETKTYFGWLYKKNKINNISDIQYVKYYKTIYNILTHNGYNHYELSTFCKPFFECIHNLTYWKNQEYIGIGAGAHSYISGKRFWNIKFPKTYIELINLYGNAESGSEFLDENRKLEETIMLLLHIDKGINFAEINSMFNINFEIKFKNQILELVKKKFISVDSTHLKLTLKGKLMANYVALVFFEVQ